MIGRWLKLGALIVAAALVVWNLALNREISALKGAALKARAENLARAREAEHDAANLATAAGRAAAADMDDLDARWAAALERVMPRFGAYDLGLDAGVRDGGADSPGALRVPAAAAPAARPCKPCDRGRAAESGAGAYEVMRLGRDLDALAARYNALLGLYNELQERSNQDARR